jgi:hypothetical protein
MSNFIEVNSTYRNRNLWPIPGQFEIPIGPNYNDNASNSVDPVSLAEPILKWTTGFLTSESFDQITAIIGSGTPIDSTMSPTTIILRIPPDPVFGFLYPQQTTDYLVGLILQTNNYRSRINSYLYLGLNSDGEPILLIKIDDEIVYNIGDNSLIKDFTLTQNISGASIIPQLFLPNGNNDDDSYLNYYIYNEYNNTYGNITSYNANYRLLTISSIFLFNEPTNNYSIRKNLPILPLPYTSNYIPLSISTYEKIYITYDSPFSKTQNFYKNYFLRIRPSSFETITFYPYYNGIFEGIYQNITSHTRRIIEYIYDAPNSIFTLENPFDNTLDLLRYTIEILPFSYDNFNPFSYTGTLVQQASCYEFELVNLILPNQILSVGNGSKIAFYPFVYVEISNVSSSSSHLLHTIYSNNPNATKMVFRVPIYDVQDAATTPFVRLVVSNMIQTIKFKPDDNLLFSVRLSNGDIYNTVIPESYSPSVPNQKIQISAIFRFKRVI